MCIQLFTGERFYRGYCTHGCRVESSQQRSRSSEPEPPMNISHYFTSPQKAPAPRPVRLTSNTQRQLGFAGPRPIIAHHAIVSTPVAKPAVPRAPRQPLLLRTRLVARIALLTAALPATGRFARRRAVAVRGRACCRHRPAATYHLRRSTFKNNGIAADGGQLRMPRWEGSCNTGATQR